MKKVMISCLLLGIIVLPLWGCQSVFLDAEKQDRTNQWKHHVAPVTLSLYLNYPQYSLENPYPYRWGKDDISAAMMQATGVRFDPILLPYDVDIGVMMASGELCDLIYYYSTLANLENDNVSHAWDDLMEAYCPDAKMLISELEWTNAMSDNGKVYTLRRGYNTDAFYMDDSQVFAVNPAAFSYREDELHRLGKDIPASIEELDDLMNRVNKQKDSLNLSSVCYFYGGQDSVIADWMGLRQDVYWDETAMSVYTPWHQAGWLNHFLLLNRWYREGILDYRDASKPAHWPVLAQESTEIFAIMDLAAPYANDDLRSLHMGG